MENRLEFYSLSWEALRGQLAGAEPAELDAARRGQWPALYSGTDGDAEAAWQAALERIIKGVQNHSSGGPDEIELEGMAVLGFVAMVRHAGSLLGAVDHVGASREYFRRVFLGRVASRCFKESSLPEYLTERSLFNLISHIYPSWGGLSQSEASEFLTRYRPPQQAVEEDVSAWLAELLALIEAAAAARQDLITLYL